MQLQFSYRFVCQGGGLDTKAAFLAASLKHFLTGSYELIACVPQASNLSQPNPIILDFLSTLNVRIIKIENPVSNDYPIGNKIACLTIPSEARYFVFLDSDILCTKHGSFFPHIRDDEVAIKLEDWNHHSDQEWQLLYNHFDLGLPVMEFRSTVLNEPMPLYFNAGVILMGSDSELPYHWTNYAQEILNNLDLPRQRINLFQLSLAAAIVKEQQPYALLSEMHNFPGELRALDHTDVPWLCHYHDPLMILADAYLTGVVGRLAQIFPLLYNLVESQPVDHWKLAVKQKIIPLAP